MNVAIKDIRNAGELGKERLVLRVLATDDIGSYIVFHAKILGKTGLSNRLRESFWFPDGRIRAGDLVVLYSKSGTDKEKVNDSGTKTHFYYWGLEEAIWDGEKSVPLLMSIEDWDYPPMELMMK